ncbi:MAG: cupin domain-containing protein [Rhizobiales bacterium]|nr:cupin domain-containing protein [Hyphomicrobiales bacterium]
MRLALAGLAALAASGLAQPAAAQQPTAIQRIELAKQMFPPDRFATFIYMVVVQPGGIVARHTHPGIEMGYTLEGDAVLSVEGQPDLKMTPGVTYSVPPGAIHGAKNTGDKPIKIVATFVVEKDKPLATPAP